MTFTTLFQIGIPQLDIMVFIFELHQKRLINAHFYFKNFAVSKFMHTMEGGHIFEFLFFLFTSF